MVQNGRISDFRGLLTLTLTLDPGMVITFFISHRVLHVYQFSSKSKKLFVDGRTHGRTDGNLPPIVLGRLPKFGSRPNKWRWWTQTVGAISCGLTVQVDWLGLRVGGQPALVQIGQGIAEICPFSVFQDGGRPPSWIFKSWKF